MSQQITIGAVGDISFGDHPVRIGHGIRSTIEVSGIETPFIHSVAFLRAHDIVIGNLETCLSDSGLDAEQLASKEMRGHPDGHHALMFGGIHIVSVANNHAMQHGSHCFWETVQKLNDVNIETVGIAEQETSNVAVKSTAVGQIAFLGYSFRPEKYASGKVPYALLPEADVRNQVSEISARYDWTIVSLHWGEEYLLQPSADQQLFARSLIKAGANVVLGHHPHVVQGVESFENGLIAYSLGNFVFDKWSTVERESIVLSITLATTGAIKWTATPIWINRYYQPTLAKGRRAKRIKKEFQRRCDVIAKGNLASGEDYAKLARRAYFRFRMKSYLFFLTRLYKYDFKIILQSATRFLRRRFGIE